MSFDAYTLPYNIYVLLFGTYISMRLACGCMGAGQLRLFSLISPVLLLIQGILMHLHGAEAVRLLYPLITHLPLAAIIVFAEKKRWNVTLVSIAVSYSICQLPRWIGLFLSIISLRPIAFVVIHIVLSHLLLLLLDRFCLSDIHHALNGPRHLFLSIGTLPIIYYLYEYFMLYTRSRYIHLPFFSELLPTGLVIFFILFVIIFQRETEKRMHAEHQMHTLELSLLHAEQEMNSLRMIEEQTAIYRHDLRHHLLMISGMLHTGKHEDALQYILQTQEGLDTLVPKRFCEHKAANLLLSVYQSTAEKQNANLRIETNLPQELNLPDTELCAILSNGLENALAAAKRLPSGSNKDIDVFLCIRQNTLLLEIKNPYHGTILIRDGLPYTPEDESHYGCRSIRSIVANQQGVCTFSAENGLFTLRIAIPMKKAASL